LLESIYDYIIKELGLNFESKERKTFFVNFRNLEKRFDPLFYSTDLYDFLNTSRYQPCSLIEVTNLMQTGFAAGKANQDLTGEGIIQIRPTNLNEDMKLIFKKCIFISEGEKQDRKHDLLKKREVLFNNTNSQELVGKSVLFNQEGDFFCSNHITRIKIKNDKINPIYLTAILNLYQKNNFFFKICTNWNNQSGVNNELLKTVKIPLPPLSVQNKIAQEVKKRMQKAERLQKEAEETIDKAKREIEKIILG